MNHACLSFLEWQLSPLTETSVFVAEQCQGEEDYQVLTIRFEPSGRIETVRILVASGVLLNPLLPYFADAFGEHSPVMVYPGSVLDDARRHWEMLSDHYPWNAFQSLVFLFPCFSIVRIFAFRAGNADLVQASLVNQPVEVNAAWTEAVPGLIMMAIPPSISAETVAQVYRQMQKAEIGREVHPVGVKNLTVFRFVQQQRKSCCWAAKGTREEWKTAFNDWNAIYPHWSFPRISDIKQAFGRTEERLLQSCRRRKAMRKPQQRHTKQGKLPEV